MAGICKKYRKNNRGIRHRIGLSEPFGEAPFAGLCGERGGSCPKTASPDPGKGQATQEGALCGREQGYEAVSGLKKAMARRADCRNRERIATVLGASPIRLGGRSLVIAL